MNRLVPACRDHCRRGEFFYGFSIMTYYIRRWNEVFEVAQSRKCASPLTWVAMPTKQGRGYRRLMRSQNATSMLGAWCAVVQLAARMPTRGVFEDQDGPLDLEDISDLTLVPLKEVEQLFKLCMSPKINWLALKEGKETGRPVGDEWESSGASVELHNITEQDITLHYNTPPLPPKGMEGGQESWQKELAIDIANCREEFRHIQPINLKDLFMGRTEATCRKVVSRWINEQGTALEAPKVPVRSLGYAFDDYDKKQHGLNGTRPQKQRPRSTIL